MTISRDLDRVSFYDIVESIQSPRHDKKLLILDSGYVPIAIPIEKYSETDEWKFSGKVFKKEKKQIANVLTGGVAVDVVTVSKDGKVMLSFWYSPESGVRAIAFPQTTVDSGVAYYCSSPHCLFGRQSPEKITKSQRD